MATIEKQPLTSMNITEEQLLNFKQLFPEVFTEGLKVDWDKLKLTLGETVDTGKERYGMNWPGKADCFKTIQQPSIATLVPARDESIDFDTTENLFIEGDNLEVLKLLQKSYLSKVKMIYIDPPYNTGNDFIYPDDFAQSMQNYMAFTGQVDAAGRSFSTNKDTNGRFHSDWLNMMYPRLFLAKNLLSEDGVIFISIDETEYSNLRKITDEIYGEENHIADFIWQNKKGGGNDSKYVAVEHEYVVMYAKNEILLHELFEPYKATYLTRYKEEDEIGKFFWDTFRRKSGKQYYPIECPDGTILDTDEIGNPISWLRSENRFKDDLIKGDVRIIKINDKWTIHFKQRLPEGKKPRSIFLEESIWDNVGTTSNGSAETLNYFGVNLFSNPKPVGLINHILRFNTKENDLILDFFAGSATTAHAVMELNKEDGGNRKYICVQLPEPTDEKSEAYKAGYKNIAEISKERIRRVSAKINAETNAAKAKKSNEIAFDELSTNTSQLSTDFGFKVFKLDKSNFKIWDATLEKEPEAIQARLFEHIDHISPEAAQESILYELLLKSGFELTTPIEKLTLADKTVFSIAGGQLLICLEKELSHDCIKAMAELQPTRVICLDEAFTGVNADALKTNAVQIMKSKGVVNFRTV